jgi:hypothetical protein
MHNRSIHLLRTAHMDPQKPNRQNTDARRLKGVSEGWPLGHVPLGGMYTETSKILNTYKVDMSRVQMQD